MINGQASIEDLGSKNGTFVAGARIDGTRVLGDGDQIRVGPVLITFRVAPATVATETMIDASVRNRDPVLTGTRPARNSNVDPIESFGTTDRSGPRFGRAARDDLVARVRPGVAKSSTGASLGLTQVNPRR